MSESRKKKFQFSKIITLVILVAITVSWARGLVLYWNELEHFNYLLDYTNSMAQGIMPYCMLSATDRLVYWQEIKNKGGQS